MAFSKALLIKGLAGAAAVGVVGGGVVLGNLPKTKEKDKNEEKVVSSGTEGDVGEDKKDRKEVNGRLETLGLEGDCLLDESADPTDFSRECSLNLEKLKKIKFSNKGEGELTVKGEVPKELKLKIEGTKEDISFSFKGISSSPLEIFGDKSKGKIVLKSEGQKFKEKDGKLTKSASVDETLMGFNEQLGKVNAPIECRFDEAETEGSVECSLTADDLKGIKFSGLGEGEIKVEGQVPDGLKLKAEKDDQNALSLSFTGLSGDLTIFVDKSKGKIVVKDGKKFRVGEDGKLVVATAVDPVLKAKIGEFNKQLRKIKAPTECKFDEEEAEESVECSITQKELKKMEFSNKNGRKDLEIVGSVDPNLKLKVERDQQNEMSLFFTGLSGDLTIHGHKSEGKIILKSSSETKFKVKGDKLEKESTSSDSTLKDKLKKFNKQLGTVEAPIECRFDDAEAEESVECSISQSQLKTMKFSNKKAREDLEIVGSVDPDLKLKVVRDQQNEMFLSFPQQTTELKIFGKEDGGKIILNKDKKFKVVGGKLTKGNPNAEIKELNKQLGNLGAPDDCRFDEAEREESLECPITQEQFKQLEFSNKGDGTLTVKTWPAGGNVKLKVEKKDQSAMSFSFPGLGATTSSPVTIYGEGGKIVIKSEEQKFKDVGGKLTKESTNVDETLKKFNEQLGKVKVPIECRFDETETEESVECDVSSDDLKTMLFSEDEEEKLTLSDESFSGMKLNVQIVKKLVKELSDMVLTFKGYDRTVGVRGDSDQEIASLVKNTNPEFEVKVNDEVSDSFSLKKKWYSKTLGDSLGLTCSFEDEEIKGECTFTKGSAEINVGKGTGDGFEKLTIKNTSNKNFEIHADVEDYNQGYRFVFKGTRVSGREGTGLENDGKYEFRWKLQDKNKVGYLVKKNP